ncbi:hypothetical protein HRM2_23520 [Desulforapulum autotrophicum HRM2]|uniref:EamA domain-containing protein n=1 Tax=Desulforapulum autotrophicum (strain ATCC 43914 / DSM 3382 / VKM B-1955 / HRM2) TaxID=177437 RepID=C0QFM9_DESAH|nr:DMT family transporter [Desulforapulum autotrophicum]ACN15447.1 hypothetical protein HRM2_23520 [Desulforapulum autotrophicum HRM2]
MKIKNRLENSQILTGYLFAIAATAIWSGNFIVARGLNETIPPITLAFCRWLVAVIVFLPFALKPLIAQWGILKKNMGYLSVTSLLGITIFNTLIYFAGHTTTAVNLSLISITFPIFIVIFSRIFFRERLTLNKGIGIVLVVTGVVLLITRGALSSLLNISFAIGDLWMLLAAIIFAVYSLLLRSKPQQLSIWAFQAATFILGLIFLFPFFVWEYTITPSIPFDTKAVVSILYVGIFASFFAFVLWNKAVVAVGPSKAGMVYYTLPLFSGFLAHFFLKENVTIIHFYSVLLIASGIFTANYEFKGLKRISTAQARP